MLVGGTRYRGATAAAMLCAGYYSRNEEPGEVMPVVFPQRNALSEALDLDLLCRRARSVTHAPLAPLAFRLPTFVCVSSDQSRCLDAQVRSGSSVMGGSPRPIKVCLRLSLLLRFVLPCPCVDLVRCELAHRIQAPTCTLPCSCRLRTLGPKGELRSARFLWLSTWRTPMVSLGR